MARSHRDSPRSAAACPTFHPTVSGAPGRTYLTRAGITGIWHQYSGISNFSYADFDIKDKQKIPFLEFGVVYVPVCLVSF